MVFAKGPARRLPLAGGALEIKQRPLGPAAVIKIPRPAGFRGWRGSRFLRRAGVPKPQRSPDGADEGGWTFLGRGGRGVILRAAVGGKAPAWGPASGRQRQIFQHSRHTRTATPPFPSCKARRRENGDSNPDPSVCPTSAEGGPAVKGKKWGPLKTFGVTSVGQRCPGWWPWTLSVSG